MNGLLDIQQKLQNFILKENLAIEESIMKPQNMEVGGRLSIYRNAYFLRLIDILESDYVVLFKIMGKEAFGSIVRNYLLAYPSRSYTVNDVGQHLAEFLVNIEGCDPTFAELVDFEWHLNMALTEKDKDCLTMIELSQIPPEQWPDMVLHLHPSVALATYNYNSVDRWDSVMHDDKDIEPVLLAEAKTYLIWRNNFEADYEELNSQQVSLLHAIQQQQNFSELCEAILQYMSEDEVVTWVAGTLQAWVEAGIFIRM